MILEAGNKATATEQTSQSEARLVMSIKALLSLKPIMSKQE
jgi:hypothetical protein